MRGGRGQVTVFVLVGLVILIVLILIYALARRLGNIPPAADGYDTQAVKGHIEQCMDLVAEDAFTLLGEQGGRLYEHQGGLHSDTLSHTIFAVDVNGDPTQERTIVGFGLMNDSGFSLRPCFAEQYGVNPQCTSWTSGTEYPYPFPSTDISILYPTTLSNSPQNIWNNPRYDGAFGQDALPLPCENGGANTKNGTLHCTSHLYPFPSQGASVQDSLEAFFTSKIKTCINIEELANLLGTTVHANEPNVTVTFTSSETAVELKLPLSFGDDGGSFKTGTFTRRYKARTYALFAFAHELLNRASKDPFFRINDSDDLDTLSLNDGFVVTQTKLLSTRTSRDDLFLVTIADSKSQVDKGAWHLNFLVQNRGPVLGYLPTIELPIVDNTLSPPDPPQRISIPVIDPDDDDLEIAFEFQGVAAGFVIDPNPICEPLNRADCELLIQGNTLAGGGTVNITVTDSTGSDWQIVSFTLT